MPVAQAETPSGITIPQPAPYPALASIEWSPALKSSVVALVSAVLMILLGVPAGLGMFAAGFLTVLLYRRRCPLDNLSAGTGARLGALSGTLGFGALGVGLALVAALRPGQIYTGVLEFVQQHYGHSGDPRMQQVLELFKTPEGFAAMMVVSLAMTCVAFLIFSSLGGVIGAVLLRRKDRP